jgi:hypothetical protein
MPQLVTLVSGEKLMRKLQRFGIALALTLTLASGAFGGIIDTPPAPPPPPAEMTGIIGTPPGDVQGPPSPSLAVEVALALVQSLLSVL